MEAMEAQTRANMKIFGDAMRMFAPFAGKAAAEAGAQASDKPAGGKTAAEGELETLRQEMAAMRDKLDKLSGAS
jgi:polyhydroxyalkanoate synthesis regulator protein